MNDKRVGRISEEIRKIISKLILQGLKDPRIDKIASVNRVELTRDYSIAKVYLSSITNEKIEDTILGLESAKGFIKREISKEIDLRIMPELIFIKDDSIEKSFEMFKKIEDLKKWYYAWNKSFKRSYW